MPLSIGKDLFEQVMHGSGFPKVFAETIMTTTGSYSCFLDNEKVGDTMSPSFLCRFLICLSKLHNMIVQVCVG